MESKSSLPGGKKAPKPAGTKQPSKQLNLPAVVMTASPDTTSASAATAPKKSAKKVAKSGPKSLESMTDPYESVGSRVVIFKVNFGLNLKV